MDPEKFKDIAGRLEGRADQPAQARNQRDDALSDSLQQLALSTAPEIPLPASSPLESPSQSPKKNRGIPGSNPTPQRIATARAASSSSLSVDRRSSTPTTPNKRRSSSSVLGLRESTPPKSISRKPSLSQLPSSPLPRSPLAAPPASSMPPIEVTAESVAKEHFKKELEGPKMAECQAKTTVIIHDMCYGHRFSRPRTSKANLNTIVERPERIRACVAGISAAYVRLGKRYTGGAHAIRPDIDTSDLAAPPFQLRKTSRTMPLSSPPVTHVHGTKWMEELKIMCDTAEEKLIVNGKELTRPATHGRSSPAAPKFHEGDLYLCAESLNALEGALGGVCEAVDSVFGSGPIERAFVCIRPPGHHCSSDFPSGFCWLNNVHVGIAHAAMTHGLTHAAIIDFDLHHGDGSQAITWDINKQAQNLPKNAAQYKKTSIGYFSLHDINSYPCEWGDDEKVRSASLCIENAHGQSIWNVHLQPYKDEAEFWRLYEEKYCVLLEKTRNYLRTQSDKLRAIPNGPQPKAAIFLSAGFDASEWEGAGMQRHKVNVPTGFYAKFSHDVTRLAQEEGLGVDGRVISVLEGGYSDRALMSGVLSHVSGLACPAAGETGVDAQMADLELTQGALSQFNKQRDAIELGLPTYDTEWWQAEILEELEEIINAPPPPPPPKRSVEKPPPTYLSSTHASNMKRVSSAKHRLSTSNLEAAEEYQFPGLARGPPEVSWAVASAELSRLLIPSDRQTLSCRHDELNAEATKIRRARLSNIGVALPEPKVPDPPVEGKRMQLRDRKSKAPVTETTKAPSRSSRRITIAAATDLPEPMAADDASQTSEMTASQPNRRLSAGSTFSSVTMSSTIDHPQSVSSMPVQDQPIPSAVPLSSSEKPVSTAAARKPKTTNTTSRTKPKPITSRPTSSRASTKTPPDLEKPRPSAHAEPNPTKQDQGVDGLLDGMEKLKIRFKKPTLEAHNASLARREKELEEAKKKAASRPTKRPSPTKTQAKESKPVVKASPIAAKDASSEGALDSAKAESVAGSEPGLGLVEGRPGTNNGVHIAPAPVLESSVKTTQQVYPGSTEPETTPLGNAEVSSLHPTQSNMLPPSQPTRAENFGWSSDEVLATSSVHIHPQSGSFYTPAFGVGSQMGNVRPPQPEPYQSYQTATSRPHSRTELPIFTAQSAIPFAQAQDTSNFSQYNQFDPAWYPPQPVAPPYTQPGSYNYTAQGPNLAQSEPKKEG